MNFDKRVYVRIFAAVSVTALIFLDAEPLEWGHALAQSRVESAIEWDGSFPEVALGKPSKLVGTLDARNYFSYDSDIKRAGMKAKPLIDFAWKEPNFVHLATKAGLTRSDTTAKDWFDISRRIVAAKLKTCSSDSALKGVGLGSDLEAIGIAVSICSPSTELFLNQEIELFTKGNQQGVEYVRVKYDAAEALRFAYEKIGKNNVSTDRVTIIDVSQRIEKSKEAAAEIGEFNELSKAWRKESGDVRYGPPILRSLQSMKLQHDVVSKDSVATAYLAFFTISVNLEDSVRAKRLSLTIKTNPPMQAVALFPGRIDVSIDGLGTKVSYAVSSASGPIANRFDTKNAFAGFRPIVFSDGLMLENFGWVLKKNAVQNGSHQFAAVLQPTKDSNHSAGDSVKITMATTVDVSSHHYAGKFLASEPEEFDVVPLAN